MRQPITENSGFSSGRFVISLDFELFWGVRDKRTIENYGANIRGVRQVIPALLELFHRYEVKATFSTVGFLFAADKEELKRFLPSSQPSYTCMNFSPYPDIDKIGQNEKDDPYHFGYSLLQMIMNSEHEIGTHTFCHYYCLEPGQTPEEFRADLQAAKKIAGAKNIQLRSLVFPRNQFNKEYLSACVDAGLDSYRGNPVSWLYEARNKNDESLFRRALRFADAYLNITGHHCHTKEYVAASVPLNVAASRFLRPWSRKLKSLESLRLRRITKAMRYAARSRRLFHLWWHPHNFGVNLQHNIGFLEQILNEYKELNARYDFQSKTMTGIVNEINGSHE